MGNKTMASAASALLLLAGCFTPPVSYVHTSPTTAVPLPPDCKVQIYMHQPPQNYAEIGIAEVEGGNMEERFSAAKKKACSVGGNGIIPQPETTALTSTESTQFRTAVTNTGRILSFSTTSPRTETNIIQKFIIIRTPE